MQETDASRWLERCSPIIVRDLRSTTSIDEHSEKLSAKVLDALGRDGYRAIRLKDRPSSCEVVVQLDGLAVGSMPIRVPPSFLTRKQRDSVTEVLFYDQPL